MLISPAYAQDFAGTFASYGQFLPIVLIFVVFYFLLIRPQQQQQKTLKARLANIKRNDRVVTGGGIIGLVTKAQDGTSEIEVEIATGVKVKILRETITTVLTDPPPANDSKPAKG